MTLPEPSLKSLNWVSPEFVDGWVSDPAGAGQFFAPVAYTRTDDGFVFFRGAVTPSSPSSATAFYLPEYLRPRHEVELASIWAINPSGFQVLWVQVKPDGRVNLQNAPGAWYWGSLDGLSFHLGI